MESPKSETKELKHAYTLFFGDEGMLLEQLRNDDYGMPLESLKRDDKEFLVWLRRAHNIINDPEEFRAWRMNEQRIHEFLHNWIMGQYDLQDKLYNAWSGNKGKNFKALTDQFRKDYGIDAKEMLLMLLSKGIRKQNAMKGESDPAFQALYYFFKRNCDALSTELMSSFKKKLVDEYDKDSRIKVLVFLKLLMKEGMDDRSLVRWLIEEFKLHDTNENFLKWLKKNEGKTEQADKRFIANLRLKYPAQGGSDDVFLTRLRLFCYAKKKPVQYLDFMYWLKKEFNITGSDAHLLKYLKRKYGAKLDDELFLEQLKYEYLVRMDDRALLKGLRDKCEAGYKLFFLSPPDDDYDPFRRQTRENMCDWYTGDFGPLVMYQKTMEELRDKARPSLPEPVLVDLNEKKADTLLEDDRRLFDDFEGLDFRHGRCYVNAVLWRAQAMLDEVLKQVSPQTEKVFITYVACIPFREIQQVKRLYADVWKLLLTRAKVKIQIDCNYVFSELDWVQFLKPGSDLGIHPVGQVKSLFPAGVAPRPWSAAKFPPTMKSQSCLGLSSFAPSESPPVRGSDILSGSPDSIATSALTVSDGRSTAVSRDSSSKSSSPTRLPPSNSTPNIMMFFGAPLVDAGKLSKTAVDAPVAHAVTVIHSVKPVSKDKLPEPVADDAPSESGKTAEDWCNIL